MIFRTISSQLLIILTSLLLASCFSNSRQTSPPPLLNLKQLRDGMSEAEVIEILGKPSDVGGSQSGGNNYTDFAYYHGEYSEGGYLSLEFFNGKLYVVTDYIIEGGFRETKLILHSKKIEKDVQRASGEFEESALDTIVEIKHLFYLKRSNLITSQEYQRRQQVLQNQLIRIRTHKK
jgi:hypothetical protein